MTTRLVRAWLVGVLTLVTGAAACTKAKTPAALKEHNSMADSADQIMYGVRMNLTTEGVNKARLMADTAYFFNDNTRIELRHVTVTFFKSTGEYNSTLRSQRGTYFTPTESMIAREDVDVETIDGRRLRTEELKYDKGSNEVSSDSAFVLTEPDRRLEGVGFRSDPDLRNLRVLRVESGSAGTVEIPNQ